MEDLSGSVTDFIRSQQFLNVVRAILIVIGGLVIARLASAFLVRSARSILDHHRQMIVKRFSYYAILTLFVITALIQLGFDLGLLLGTAGILTVALAFASQTSMSNLISGLFLIAESPFKIGDTVQIGSTIGEILEIDLLSVKLRKADNTFVRLPNELLIKTEFWTLTKFPLRRLDLTIGVALNQDIGRVREILTEVADKNPMCLEEPRPQFTFQGFGESALETQFSVWVLKENYIPLRDGLQEEIKLAFDAAGIEIPFPHRSLYTGNMTEPFPVRVVASEPGSV